MAYFPMFVDITDCDCLIIGGGKVAFRKVQVLLDFGANVTVIAQHICEEIKFVAESKNDEENKNTVTYEEREYKLSDCDERILVIAATDSHEKNHEIAEYCKARRIPINAVDQKEDCSFIFPSYVREKDLVAAFSSAGSSPLLTQILKEEEKKVLTPYLGALNEALGSIREEVKKAFGTEKERKAVYRMIYERAVKEEIIPSKHKMKEWISCITL
ncbi:MAG: bifunctional precorrin-2 dehydrogenase/sirohydrochlorin ferrochelatase [Lachnospiraceae bacterium]|nr:bifunctional precorrin-2 dehydrogenase/sirohydrochlorin ferrochelatase [Lachnospiraceae bacterium]